MSAASADGFIDPRALTPAQRTALMNVHDFLPRRGAGGFGRRPEQFVSLKLAETLIRHGLARIDISRRGHRLLITGKGFNTWSVMMARMSERKRA